MQSKNKAKRMKAVVYLFSMVVLLLDSVFTLFQFQLYVFIQIQILNLDAEWRHQGQFDIKEYS